MFLAAFNEARADHYFSARGLQRIENAWYIGWIVLTVAIYPNDKIETHLEGKLITGLHAPPEAEVHWKFEHLGACLRSGECRAVGRVIIDYKHWHSGKKVPGCTHNISHCPFFVERGNDYHHAGIHPE